MKKINKLFILPLLALSLFNVNYNSNKSNDFYLQLEETTNDTNIIGVRKELSSSTNEDVKVSSILKVQASDEEDGKRSLRFVAGISSLSLNAHFHRDEIKVNDEVIMNANDIEITCAYSKILNGEQEQTASEVFGSDYNYFVAYTLKDIPEDYWSTVINVSLVLDNSETPSAYKKANVDAFGINDTTLYKFDAVTENNKIVGYDISPNDYDNNKSEFINVVFPKYYYENVTDNDTEFIGKKTNIIGIGHCISATKYYGFGNNNNLKSVVIPKGVKNINYGAFGSCTSLESIILPSTLEKIDHYAFNMCINLKSIIIPENVKIVGSDAFFYCSNLEYVIMQSNIITFSDGNYGIFAAHNNNFKIYDLSTTSNFNEKWGINEDTSSYYLYSETSKTASDEDKKNNVTGYWHYVNNEPVIW